MARDRRSDLKLRSGTGGVTLARDRGVTLKRAGRVALINHNFILQSQTPKHLSETLFLLSAFLGTSLLSVLP